MPTDATGQGEDGREDQGPRAAGPLADPRWLAAGAGGLAAACLALWAFRGLPLGPVAFWLVPLPLFLAGMGFGPAAGLGAAVVAAAALWPVGPALAPWIVTLGFGLPAVLLVASAHRGLGHPLALLGALPAAGIAAAAFWLSDMPGGLEGTLRLIAESTLSRLDLPGSAGLVTEIVRVKAAAIGFWLALALLGNAWLAGRLLARAGLSVPPAWSTARLPAWYAALPALAFGLWMGAEEGADAVPLSLLLVLLVPLLLHGLAALHRLTRGLGERPLLLGALYIALVVLFLPASLAVAGYGAFDLIRNAKTGGGRAAPPPHP